MKRIVEGLGIEIVGLNDINMSIDIVEESGDNPLENARIKALAYYEATKTPVFSCDSGLYIEGISTKEQPGVYVRRVSGKELNDEEMIEHYSSLALRLGGNAKAKYRNAICLVIDEETIFEYDGEDMSSESFLIGSKPHHKRTIGFPLNSLSINIETGKYYMDMENRKNEKDSITIGFRDFFKRTIL